MQFALAALALAAGANAHTLFSELYVDGKAQGDGTCVREPASAVGAVDPITDLGSSDMACGQQGTVGVSRTCSVNGGSSLTFEYRQWPDDVSKGPLAMGHMGPCAVYLKKVDNATEDLGIGDGWFKLWDDGYDGPAGNYEESNSGWCTQKMIGNNGRLTVQIPDSLASGDYLVRPELLALHNVFKGTPEFYVGCAQIYLESSGSSGPESTVSIPGYVSKTDPATTFDVWAQPMALPYPKPGPAVYTSSSSNSFSTSSKQADGLAPSDCILINANWCGTELPDFSDSEGCWAADKICWAQLNECYASAPPTGSANCKIWEDKCTANQGLCNGGGSGPANKGQVLTPQASTIDVPAALNAAYNYGAAAAGAIVKSASSVMSVASSAAPSSYSSSATSTYQASYPAAPSSTSTSTSDYVPEAPATTSCSTSYETNSEGVVTQTAYDYETVTDVVYVTARDEPAAHLRRHQHHKRQFRR